MYSHPHMPWPALLLALACHNSLAQTTPPGLMRVQSQDGCGVLIRSPEAAPEIREQIQSAATSLSRLTWTGPCKDGLYHGEGSLLAPEGANPAFTKERVWYLRGVVIQAAPQTTRMSDGTLLTLSVHKHFVIQNLDSEYMPLLGERWSRSGVTLLPPGQARAVFYTFLAPSTIEMSSFDLETTRHPSFRCIEIPGPRRHGAGPRRHGRSAPNPETLNASIRKPP
jgi:hypothetical protein